MLGAELSLCFKARGMAHIGTDREVDITDAAALEAFAAEQVGAIAVIVNCAAYTAVDKAEDDADFCRLLNTAGPANIAKTAKKTMRNSSISVPIMFLTAGEYSLAARRVPTAKMTEQTPSVCTALPRGTGRKRSWRILPLPG
jgi:dTDP-4-dehydrorhamnose reductase